MASSIVSWPRMLPAYASREWEPLSSQSLRCSNGPTSATSCAPASSQRGRPAGNRPDTTHSLNGSVGTGRRPIVRSPASTRARSLSVVRRGDPVHHRGGEVDVGVDPGRQRLVHLGRQVGHHDPGHLAVLGQVVAGQDGDRTPCRRPVGRATRPRACLAVRGPRCRDRLAARRCLRRPPGGPGRAGPSVAQIAGLGDGDGDDRGRRVGQVARGIGRGRWPACTAASEPISSKAVAVARGG